MYNTSEMTNANSSLVTRHSSLSEGQAMVEYLIIGLAILAAVALIREPIMKRLGAQGEAGSFIQAVRAQMIAPVQTAQQAEELLR